MNLPNKLSLLRIAMIPIFLALYFLPFAFAPYAAFAVFVLAAFTDFLDGYIARKRNLVTDLGKLLDPIADKLLVCAALFAVVATDALKNTYFEWSYILLAVCAAVIIGRELLVSAIRQIAAAKGKVVAANVFGKVKTVLQDIALPALIILKARDLDAILPESFYNVMWWIAIVAFVLATIMTIVSGIIYLIQNKNVFAGEESDK
ncbi:MAG: CDP-diacylglycerol--glycerol-3-phosphate 3-phosphatidyltransferase [Corallococcus sp.]|nr:CDP-diacylglycerol--glycerol-3-phosphate 3-phosphatidyltransferase [Corallococcus sp.]